MRKVWRLQCYPGLMLVDYLTLVRGISNTNECILTYTNHPSPKWYFTTRWQDNLWELSALQAYSPCYQQTGKKEKHEDPIQCLQRVLALSRDKHWKPHASYNTVNEHGPGIGAKASQWCCQEQQVVFNLVLQPWCLSWKHHITQIHKAQCIQHTLHCHVLGLEAKLFQYIPHCLWHRDRNHFFSDGDEK